MNSTSIDVHNYRAFFPLTDDIPATSVVLQLVYTFSMESSSKKIESKHKIHKSKYTITDH